MYLWLIFCFVFWFSFSFVSFNNVNLMFCISWHHTNFNLNLDEKQKLDDTYPMRSVLFNVILIFRQLFECAIFRYQFHIHR